MIQKASRPEFFVIARSLDNMSIHVHILQLINANYVEEFEKGFLARQRWSDLFGKPSPFTHPFRNIISQQFGLKMP